MIDIVLDEADRMIRDVTRRFVDEELIPLEQEILRADAEGREQVDEDGNRTALAPEVRDRLQAKAKEIGLWQLDLPKEEGGAGVTELQKALIYEELGRTITPLVMTFDAPNIRMLEELATPYQVENYLLPLKRGEKMSCFMLTEPEAGGDARGIKMPAVRDGDNWVLNGTKLYITNANRADFAIVMTVTDPEQKPRAGFTAFLVDLKNNPGVEVTRPIKTVTGGRIYEVQFTDCVVPDQNMLGERGQAFRPMQRRLGVRRLQICCSAVGAASRALQMGLSWSKQRITFGTPLADRQAIQWMFADAHANIYASRTMLHDAVRKSMAGQDIRHEISIIKPFTTEMSQKVIDDMMQIHGGAGMTSDLVLERMWRSSRPARIFEGPSEVHRQTNARLLLESV